MPGRCRPERSAPPPTAWPRRRRGAQKFGPRIPPAALGPVPSRPMEEKTSKHRNKAKNNNKR